MKKPPPGRLYTPADRPCSPNPASPVWDFLPPTGFPECPGVEARVAHVVPPTGYLRWWVEHMHARSDAPSLYQVVSWLTVLATLTNRDYRVPTAGGFSRRVNVYTLLVGPSAHSRKTHSVARAVDRLVDAAPNRVGENPGSAQGLISAVEERPEQLIPDEDLGELLQAGAKGPMQQVKMLLLKLFDNGSLSYRLKNSTVSLAGGEYNLSFLGAINIDLLERFSEPTDFTGGLFSRFLVAEASRVRSIPGMGVEIPADLEVKANVFFTNALRLHAEHCPRRTLTIHRDARELMIQWEGDVHSRYVESRNRANVQPSFARLTVLVAKLSALYAFDRFISSNGTQTPDILPEDARYAIGLVEEHIASVVRVFGSIAQTPYLRKRRLVLSAIPEFTPKNQYVSSGQICKATGLELREVKSVLETLLAEETIRSLATGSKTGAYQISPVSSTPVAPVSPAPAGAPPHSFNMANTVRSPLPTHMSYGDDEPPAYGEDEDY